MQEVYVVTTCTGVFINVFSTKPKAVLAAQELGPDYNVLTWRLRT